MWTEIIKAAYTLHLLTLDDRRLIRPPLLPHDLGLVHVEGEVTVLTSRHQNGHFRHVVCHVHARDASYHSCFVHKLQDDIVLVGGHIVVAE